MGTQGSAKVDSMAECEPFVTEGKTENAVGDKRWSVSAQKTRTRQRHDADVQLKTTKSPTAALTS
jgi:hypothetical protein